MGMEKISGPAHRCAEPLQDWDGQLYNFIDYVVAPVEAAWEWDEPAKAAQVVARITPGQLGLWAILNANGQVCNGGFSQFFFNSYGELAEEALQGFRLFGMDDYAGIFESAYAMFRERPIPKNREKRIEILASIADDTGEEEVEYDPGVPMQLQYFGALAERAGQYWSDLETRYYALIHRKGVAGGYNAAFFRPLVDFIEAHPEEFFARA